MKVLVVSENNRLLEDIASFSGFKKRGIQLVTLRSNLLNASQSISNEMPDIVVIDVSQGKTNEFELTERFKAQYKNMTFMMMSDDASSELLLKAIRSGISEVITIPLTEPALMHALDRYEAKLSVSASHQSRVISFISCKGGGGSTFISTNLGFILAEVFKKKVLLIDLNQYFGDASMYMSEQKPSMTLADVCNQISRLDFAFLESSLIEVTPRYKVLAAAENPANASDIKPDHIDTIIRLAKNYYDYVILDVGRQIDAVTVKGMDLSDHIYPVVQLVLPYIRDAKNLLEIFKSLGYSSNKVNLIVNRYDKSSKLKLGDLNNALNAIVSTTIPNHYASVTESVNQGVPVYKLAKNSPVTKALVTLAEDITSTKLKEKGIFSKMLGN
ncbi:MAG TPA: AAA family ATPase [Methylophilus sp.]